MNFKRISGNRWSCCLRTFKGLFLDLLLLRFVEFEPQIDMANKSASICSLVRENENLLENILFFFCALSFGGGTNSDPNPNRVSWRSELSFSSQVLPSADSILLGLGFYLMLRYHRSRSCSPNWTSTRFWDVCMSLMLLYDDNETLLSLNLCYCQRWNWKPTISQLEFI